MLLHLLVFAPFIVAILMIATSKEDPKSSSRLAILFGAVFVVLAELSLLEGAQMTKAIDWFNIPLAKGPVQYLLQSNGLSSWMVLLSAILSLVSLIVARQTTCKNYRNFAIGIFALMGAMNGTFLAGDAVLFFVFFEAMVIPAAILIAAFGGKERLKAAMTFAIYTLVGSAPMMIALWYLLTVADNSSMNSIVAAIATLPESATFAVMLSFIVAFLVKTPIFPLHGWQAISYAEAPAPLSAILTGAMSKAGVYGLMAWVLPVFGMSVVGVADTLMWLGLITAIYGALMALRATDAKKLLAYSSMGHLGFAVAGVFTLSEAMFPAVLVLLVAHGISAGAQFYLIGVAERMVASRELSKMGGLVRIKPVFGALFGAAGVMALAVPGTAGFVGEFTVLLTIWDKGPLPAVVAGLCLILSAAYMLRFIQKVIFGENTPEISGKSLSGLEGSAILILVLSLLVFGFHPAYITDALYHYKPLTGEEILSSIPDEGVNKEKLKEYEQLSLDSLMALAGVPVEERAGVDSSLSASGLDERNKVYMFAKILATEVDANGGAMHTPQLEQVPDEEIYVPMTEAELATLDSNLKANGFTDEERKSLIQQLQSQAPIATEEGAKNE